MAQRLYVLTARWPEKNGVLQYGREALEAKMTTGGLNWLRCNAHTWLFWADAESYTLQQYLTDHTIMKDFILLQTHPKTRAGWGEKWIWEWIDNHTPT